MKTNLLAQNDNLVIENLKADVGKSVMDLSHSVTFPVGVDGALYPICCVETVPSDSFEINVECLLRQLTPLKVPLMTNFRLNTAFYYCDNRLAWKKWDRFMTGGRTGNEVFDVPRVANSEWTEEGVTKISLLDVSPVSSNPDQAYLNINFKNNIHTYLGISMNRSFNSWGSFSDFPDDSEELPLAFAEFDYQIIKRDYYTNVDRLPENPETRYKFYDYSNPHSDWAYSNLFPPDDDEIRLQDGPQVKSGFQSGDDQLNVIHGFVLDKMRYHDVRPDYFTSSKKAPMRGTAPTLGANSSLVLPTGTKITFNPDDLNIYPMFARGSDYAQGDINFTVNSNNVINGVTSDGPLANTTITPDGLKLNGLKNDFHTLGDVELSGKLTADWTAADISLLSQLTVWQELNMLHEPYYNDFLNAHFDGVRVGESPVEKAQYIGGTSQLISINEILQTSQSTETSPLGNQGATAMSLANNFVGRYYCNNYGYIIGIAYIIPELMYKPAMPRHFSRRTKEDYYSPEFANLSMQATLNKEIFFSNDNDWNNSPWGYTGAFDEMRSIPNRIAGDLLNPSYTDLQKWVLTREMSNDNLPAMESTWLSLKGNVDETAWSVTEGFPKFMLQVANYIKAVRPMPKIAIPKAL